MRFFSLKTRLAFGEGSLSYLRSVAKGHERVLIFSSRSMRVHGFLNEAMNHVEDAGAGVMVVEGVPPEPSYEYVEEVLPRVKAFGPDMIVAIGGGSVIDVAKAVKVFYDSDAEFEEVAVLDRFNPPLKRIPPLRTPLVAIPSTSGAGSEVSAASVLKYGDLKYTLVSFEIAPEYAILDPRLPRGMPPKVARNSGLDVLVHAIEAYTTTATTPFSDALALRATKAVFEWLPKSLEGDPEAREEMHYAATMAGIAFLNARLGLAHAMSHKAAWMGEHGYLNAVLLPHVMEFNMRDGRTRLRYAEIARELGLSGAEELVEKVRELSETLKVEPLMERVDEGEFLRRLDEMAEKAHRDPLINFNPIEPTVNEIKELYRKAFYTH
ncbi:iron-containing alcohol dehydrogenase [Palaeococcus ferrophilus]|uniref:iron-containing alcohol dehydrogenase n=1 Tax=Palaeococcus ferrophilus TaxID=83868 RepID=UPI00064F031E|nr:iron-containing alcohol dehydrogenase [Palaeococcus ferrophilus]